MKHIITITDKDITGSDKLSSAKPRIAVNAVLFDKEGNIALSYLGKYDLYTLPGGGVDAGEDFQTAVKREVWEEAGCRCEVVGELGEIFENRGQNDFTQQRLYFTARVIGEKGSLHLTNEEIEEQTDVVWLPFDKALELICDKQHDKYMHIFIQKRDTAALNEAKSWMKNEVYL